MVELDLKKQSICSAICYAIVVVILHILIYPNDGSGKAICNMRNPVTHNEWFLGWIVSYYAAIALYVAIVILLTIGKKNLAEKLKLLELLLILFFWIWSIVGLVSYFDPQKVGGI